MNKIKKSGLGKGLDALFVDNKTEDLGNINMRVSEIEPNSHQPRKTFNEQALAELADSIKEHGIIQPLLVRPLPTGGYQIVAGERRWRASRMIGLDQVPVVIMDLDKQQVMEISLIENLQREDLNIIEEADGYRLLMDEFQLTQEEVSNRVGKSRPVIANAIRLLNLPEQVVDMVREEKISAGHGRALLSLEDKDLIIKVAQQVSTGKLTVRDIENMAKNKKKPEELLKKSKPVYYREVELSLTESIGHKVTINTTGKKSTLQIEFYDEDQLKQILNQLKKD